MAPIKFEEDLRDKIEQRQLQPSSDAWQKLSDRLDAEPKKRNSKTFWWLGIAASFVGVLIISSLFFSKESRENMEPQILVNEEIKEVKGDQNVKQDLLVGEEGTEEAPLVIDAPENTPHKDFEIVTSKHEDIVEVEVIDKLHLEDKNVFTLDSTNTIAFKATPDADDFVPSKSPEEIKMAEVVDQILKLQEAKSQVSDAEIDALLNQAQKELMAQRIYNTTTQTVDAELLLLQVETDLDQSFRDRVFEALKSGYKKVKTAVADRNQ